MSRPLYDLQGFAVVLDKVALVSRVFAADNNEGYQFNITSAEPGPAMTIRTIAGLS